MSAWVGNRYSGVLLLLESTYGSPDATPRSDVEAFLAGGADATFARLARVLGREFFDLIALDNVADEPVGPDNACKVTDAALRAGAATLPERLAALQSRAVWIASKRAAPFALPVIERYGAKVVVTAHPLYPVNVSDAALLAAWAELTQKP